MLDILNLDSLEPLAATGSTARVAGTKITDAMWELVA
jgi:hypothetical protein